MPRWIWAAIGLPLVMICVFFVDQPLMQWLDLQERTGVIHWGREITDVGLGENWFVLAIAGYVIGRWVWKNKKLKTWGAHQFWALIIAGISVQILKLCIGRQRPHMSETFEPQIFHPLTTDPHFHSLPSGHTQVLFTVATITSLWLPKNWRWSVFVLAFALAFTRVLAEQHFPGDIAAGALTGFYGSWLSLTLWKRKIPLPN